MSLAVEGVFRPIRTGNVFEKTVERVLQHSSCQHRTIVEAILAGDVAATRSAVEEHLEGTAALLRGFLA